MFGLQLECEPDAEGGVEGRFFVKQDHQGQPGYAHGGVMAAALDEAMALVLHSEGTFAPTGRLEIDLLAPAPVGAFVGVAARVEEREERKLVLSAQATDPARDQAGRGPRGVRARQRLSASRSAASTPAAA